MLLELIKNVNLFQFGVEVLCNTSKYLVLDAIGEKANNPENGFNYWAKDKSALECQFDRLYLIVENIKDSYIVVMKDKKYLVTWFHGNKLCTLEEAINLIK